MEFLNAAPQMLLAAAGIGLVIFVHELGHFLAARWCGVRVEVFSLGFGPRVLSWVRGTTRYQLALVPIGGYVRMAGEEGRPAGAEVASDHLWAKPVGQRFFIYSGGVLMNVLFGLIVFPILFARGVPFTEPVIGDVLPGGPAWQARLRPGTRVLEVNQQPIFEFGHVLTQVALGDPQATTLLVQAPGDTRTTEVVLEPRLETTQHLYTIDVGPPLDAEGRLSITLGGAAEKAGLREGDRLLAVLGAPAEFSLSDQLSWATSLLGPVTLRVLQGEATDPALARDIRIEPEAQPRVGPPRLGISPPRNHVTALRANPERDALGLRTEDRILALDDAPIRRYYDLELALLAHAERAESAGRAPLRMRVRRAEQELVLESPPLDRARALRLAEDIALRSDSGSTEVTVSPGEAAALAGLRDGDRILSVDDTAVASWKGLQELIARAAKDNRAVALHVERPILGEAPALLDIDVDPQPLAGLSWGFATRTGHYVYRSDTLGEAVRAGVMCSWRFIEDSWLTVKRMLLGQVGSENIGGIITISRASYSWAEEGVAKLFYFLAMLSINLAFLNVLPIPVLDGGHLFFLIIEKLKGSPVSNRVLGTSQAVGVVLLLSLMVYVTYNDLVRWVFRS
jgi:regulator of sigma E protease